jgi:hypothetical protein
LKTFRRFRLLSVALVLLLHLGFLLVLQGVHIPAPRPQVSLHRLAPTVLVLLPPLQAQIKTSPQPEGKRLLGPARTWPSLSQAATPPLAAEPAPAAISPNLQTGPASPSPQPSSAATAAPLAAVASAASKPLNLSLSREAMRALPAAPAPQLPPPRLALTAEQHIANTLAVYGNGPWVEERLDAEHVRFRRGDRCITYTRSQTAGLFPFDEAAQRTPWSSAGIQACPN